MKLSDFKGEEALELMADIVEPASQIINDPKTKELRADRPKLIQHVLKDHAKETLKIYELLYKEDGDKATPISLLNMVVDILADPDLQSLFTSQGQKSAETPSGSVTENTKDGKK